MATPAQFGKGEVVWYTGDAPALDKQLAVIVEVTQDDPAQYHVAMTKDSSVVTCGEGIDEPGAVSAL
jgi:molybdenum cofactor biosynthesis enzyme MoaA